MGYLEHPNGPPYFDWNNYSRWAVWMTTYLAGKGSLDREVTEDEGYELPVIQVTQLDRDKVDANNKAVDLLYHSLGPNEFDRVMGEKMANKIWAKLHRAHIGDDQVLGRLFQTYRREYENFTHLPSESTDDMFKRFTVIVNNMRTNIDAMPYTDQDRALKLLHSLDRTVWGAKVEAIMESASYATLTVDELFSKLESSKIDMNLRTKTEKPSDQIALVSSSKEKHATANLSQSSFSFVSCLMSLTEEQLEEVDDDDLALLSRKFSRFHDNCMSRNRSRNTCFNYSKP